MISHLCPNKVHLDLDIKGKVLCSLAAPLTLLEPTAA